jgi:hypothetical protein
VLFRSALLSAAFWVVFLTGVRVAAVPPEDCGENNAAAIESSARLAIAWIENNQLSDGTFVYEYNAETNALTPEYNTVRHAGVTMALYQAAGHFQDRTALAAADEALVWMIQKTVHNHGWAALATSGTYAELGSSDLMLVSLEERRLDTGDTRYDGLMRQLGRFIVSLQRDDGGFYIGYDLSADAPQTYGTSKYYPGESLLGLALLHETFPAEGWDAPARKALDFIATQRDEVEDVDFPPLADQWTGYALGEMAGWGLSDQQIDYARSLAARFGFRSRIEAERQGSWYGHAVRGRHARGAGSGTWIEGMAGLWRASQQDPRLADLAAPLKERAVCVSGIMAANQVSPKKAASYGNPTVAAGAWFSQGVTRMDDQQHTLSGLMFTLDALAGDANQAPSSTIPAASP